MATLRAVFVSALVALAFGTVACGTGDTGGPDLENCPVGQHLDPATGLCVDGCLAAADCDDGNDCTNDLCDSSTGECTNEPILGCGACEDASACDDQDACTEDLCDDASQRCVHRPIDGCCTEAVACDDGDVCTTDVCNGVLGCDHIKIAGCQAPCEGDADCNDDNPCTADSCDPTSALCSNSPEPDCVPCTNIGNCDDGDTCTADICDAGRCRWAPIPNCGIVCLSDADCADGDDCTDDVCDTATGVCSNTMLPGCFPCVDDTECAGYGDLCNSGICVAGFCEWAARVCDDDDECTADSCDPATGECVFLAVPGCGQPCSADEECADGDPCTFDRCDPTAGLCVNEPDPACVVPCTTDGDCPVSSDLCERVACIDGACLTEILECADGDPCTADACDPTTGACVFEPLPDCAGCTADDQCADLDPCTDDRCDLETGLCSNLMLPGCFPCESDLDCPPTGDLCLPAVCEGALCQWVPVACDDGDGCTNDLCDPLSGDCLSEPIPGCAGCTDDADCGDGDPCTLDQCVDGGCTWLPIVDCEGCRGDADCSDGNPCTADTCDEATGRCESAPAPDGTRCDDGDACTMDDRCHLGGCFGVALRCDDGDPCTAESCDPASGLCVSGEAPDGTPCDDADGCTRGDICIAGLCNGEARDCDDQNACTADACLDGVCVHAATPDCVPCLTAADCGDGDPCTADVCLAGVCTWSLIPGCTGCTADEECDDANACTRDVCVDETGHCSHWTFDDGTECEDRDPCTVGDQCWAGVCLGVARDCADGNACTDDDCDSTTGGCRYTDNDAGCDDGDVCTLGDVCRGGDCLAGPVDACDDGDPCTADSCDPAGGCTHEYDPRLCPVVCRSNADCSADLRSYCAKPLGDCDGEGRCEPRPALCPPELAPVCGCDGITYPNTCFASAAGVNVASEGECAAPACRSNAECGDSEFCHKLTGLCDDTGVCETRPLVCPDYYRPVCGCDGQTYDNDCWAYAAGVSLGAEGECAATCTTNEECIDQLGRNFYCAKDRGDCDGRGVCEVRPTNCPPFLAPVCGCDGLTYPNECLAALAGINVASEGECAVAQCRDNADCGERAFCSKGVGDCLGLGVCADRPASCNDIYDPVCGCDGRTYDNACFAAQAGVNVASAGACGTRCTTNTECMSAAQYCSKPNGDCAGTGTCADRPRDCPPVLDPVCGCDDRTYTSACVAAAAGVNVAYAGRCVEITCLSNTDCPGLNQICHKPDGACDARGVCEARPATCAPIEAPVCGCDGVTYDNECLARQAGTSVASQGACSATRCRTNDECGGDADFCQKTLGNCDGTGACAERPAYCIPRYEPVCGCDGVTYFNECLAWSAGVNAAYAGVCQQGACRENGDCESLRQYCVKAMGDCDGTGRCEARPDACFPVEAPVCGCDGETYTNACYAGMAGVNVAHEGECISLACRSDADCPGLQQFCLKAVGDCDGVGTCTLPPTGCPDIRDPVCGCDGVTYLNECIANARYMNVRVRGTCAAAACTTNNDCATAGQYCEKSDGDCAGRGFCVDRPRECPADIWDPVCGCDGVTYAYDCLAALAGASVAYAGQCVPATECRNNSDCEADTFYCAKSLGRCGGRGVCTARPAACPAPLPGEAVCGCDDLTYASACYAAQAGVNLLQLGECPTTATCRTNLDCPADTDYCAKADNNCLGTGTCEARPTACTPLIQRVCGCDLSVYLNACYAHAAGQNVLRVGQCPGGTQP